MITRTFVCASSRKYERLLPILPSAQHLDDYDVILLQEMFELGSSRQRRLLSIAHRRGFRYYVKSVPPALYEVVASLSLLLLSYLSSLTRFRFSRKFIDAGLVILSRFPIQQSDCHIYTQGPAIHDATCLSCTGNQIDDYAAKQMLYAKIDISSLDGPSPFLHVFTTHMQASYFENEEHVNAINDLARMSQVEIISFLLSSLLISGWRS